MNDATMSTKLLIVDDNKEIRERLINHFNAQPNTQVIGEAADGLSAFQLIKEKSPDAVIMDVVLTGIDGFALMEKINNLEQKKPNMLILSALCKEDFIHKAFSLGASYYMIKPFDVENLSDRLREIMSQEVSPSVSGFARQAPREEEVSVRPHRSTRTKIMEEKITNIFITVGIPAHIKGYQFLREAIKMAIEQPEIINSITKKLYPCIASKFETSASKVERAIRHAIEVAWNRGKIENINALFGIKVYSNNEKPTNGEFIALVADKMLLEGA